MMILQSTKSKEIIQSDIVKIHTILWQMIYIFGCGVLVDLFVFKGVLSGIAILASFMILFGFLLSFDEKWKKLYTLLFSFCFGLICGPFIYYAYTVNPAIILLALIGTGIIFFVFTIGAKYIPDSSQVVLGGFLLASLLITIVVPVLFLFYRQTLFIHIILTWISIIFFCGHIAYDTKEMYLAFSKNDEGKQDHYYYAITMFLNLINIFAKIIKVLILLDQKKKSGKKNI